MWVFTPDGFYSAVIDPLDDHGLVVRARDRGDADRLSLALSHIVQDRPRPNVIETPGRDYRYRMFIPRRAWAAYLAEQALDMDYGNFKAEVERVRGLEREQLYMRVWSVMHSSQVSAYRAPAPRRTADLWDSYPDFRSERYPDLHEDPDGFEAALLGIPYPPRGGRKAKRKNRRRR